MFDDERSRLKQALKSCRSLIANYRAMLTDSSNDNPIVDVPRDDSEAG